MADSPSISIPTDRRAEAALCWIAAAELLALILLLAGAIPNVGVLDTVLSVAAPPLCLGAFAVLFTQLRPSVWALLALLFQAVNTTMVLTGDALQHVVFHSTNTGLDMGGLWVITTAIRDTVGNNFLYVALSMVGCLLLGDRRNWLGGLALVNAALGWLDLAFARGLGLPPHVNFLLIVVWLVMLGISTLQRSALAEGGYRRLFTAQSADV
jgi:hypothetical protein